MVSGLALYSDNESLNPAEINVSYSEQNVKITKINEKVAEDGPIKTFLFA